MRAEAYPVESSSATAEGASSSSHNSEAPIVDVGAVQALVQSHMEQAVELAVPLEVEAQTGQDWLEAH